LLLVIYGIYGECTWGFIQETLLCWLRSIDVDLNESVVRLVWFEAMELTTKTAILLGDSGWGR
jgi:hypothetical protein